jgi:hypothetical protein
MSTDTADNAPHSASHGASHNAADTDQTRWMTFAELAQARGIDKRSAVVLVRRHGWRRQRNNEGHVIALVPASWAASDPDSEGHGQPDSGGHSQSDNAADTGTYRATFEIALAAIEAAHAGELAALRDERDEAERARLAVQTVANTALAQLADAQAGRDRLEASLAGERTRADALRDRVDMLTGELREAQEAASALRQAEKVAKRARGLLARLRAALRGG